DRLDIKIAQLKVDTTSKRARKKESTEPPLTSARDRD
ncbi:unnamed protein product, partial [Rotaria magnacalcarata]